MRSIAIGVCTALGAVAAAAAGEAAAGYSFWKSVTDNGLALAVAVSAFIFMLAYIRRADKERREDTQQTATRLREVENFQRDTLLKTTMQAAATMDRVTEATDRQSHAIETLASVVDLMRMRFNFRPCMALESLSDEDRRTVMRIFEGHQKDHDAECNGGDNGK